MVFNRLKSIFTLKGNRILPIMIIMIDRGCPQCYVKNDAEVESRLSRTVMSSEQCLL